MQRSTFALLAGAWLIIASAAFAQDFTETVDPKYTWDLTEIYPSVETWNKAREEVMQDFGKIEERRGTLGNSAVLSTATCTFSSTRRRRAQVRRFTKKS